ncbi:vitamin K epoxide reductase family protein [Hymenobacter cheonanensis]|uniref:vitamin K epoxide reductase family protein n=1 Tax=Hymenobacter sp. CA2-7 TaxID=3063993 RepID=UPI0027124C14|nr:vitamin K epoxide reductase family protein [Hymenobacter sp. CA2-7]MDO7884248.1 vitamin K epoxide reductase family protein [Hymenobacter sp. CA2-7]
MLTQFDPIVNVTFRFLQLLGIKANSSTLNEVLQSHPDWPSLLCISDTLTNWNIPNGAGKVTTEELDSLPVPFLTQLVGEGPALITQLDAEQVTIYQGASQKTSTLTRSELFQKWNGLYLIAEPSSISGEPSYEANKKKTFINRVIPSTAIILLLIASLILFDKTVSNLGLITRPYRLGLYGQYAIMLAGTVVSTLLVWYEIDGNNSVLRRVCTSIAKSDCSAILTSRRSKVFSWLSWSEVGLFYFGGGLLSLLLGNSNAVSTIAWLNLLALPYTVFSVYYQWKVMKQWCVLCLAVQMLLVLGGVNVLLNGLLNPLSQFNFTTAFLQLITYLLMPVVWYCIKPYFVKIQESNTFRRKLLRLKFDSNVFSTLLKSQKNISHMPSCLGIELGNPQAQHTLVKVCNVFCSPCSKAHPEIEKLLALNTNLKVKIIFATRDIEFDAAFYPTQHLLAIAAKANTDELQQALNDWHSLEVKDYNRFATRHPVDKGLLDQAKHIMAMNSWCKEAGISHTPTFFLNDCELPDFYNLEDLQYFLLDPIASNASI